MAIFNLKTSLAVSILFLVMAAVDRGQNPSNTSPQLPPDDCSWQPRGAPAAGAPARPALREPVKLRTADQGKDYVKYNHGKPITIDQWFAFTCGLDPLVPKEVPADKPIDKAETVRVTLRAYLLGTRFMRNGDHDLIVELGASPDWTTDHIVAEMSPGTEYCAARKALWKLVTQEGCQEDQCVMKKPVEILLTGYVFLFTLNQTATSNYCQVISNRGLKKGEQPGRIRGLWRLQPVLSVKKV